MAQSVKVHSSKTEDPNLILVIHIVGEHKHQQIVFWSVYECLSMRNTQQIKVKVEETIMSKKVFKVEKELVSECGSITHQ